jgi:hypothetical protein
VGLSKLLLEFLLFSTNFFKVFKLGLQVFDLVLMSKFVILLILVHLMDLLVLFLDFSEELLSSFQGRFSFFFLKVFQ